MAIFCLLQLKASKQRETNLQANLNKFLNPDQLEKLKLPPDSKGEKIIWSNNTVQRCLVIIKLLLIVFYFNMMA